MTKYEYKVVKFEVAGWMGGKIDGDHMERQLNQHGSEGWDLLEVVPVTVDMGCTKILVATMKRSVR